MELTARDVCISRSVLDNMLAKQIEHNLDHVVYLLEEISKRAKIMPTNIYKGTEENIDITIKTLNRMKELSPSKEYCEIDYVLTILNNIVEYKDYEK